jgi:hypothetical protein
VALSQQHRSSLYLTLSSLVGTEEAEALLSEFPANDRETPATKDFVRAEAAVTRAEVREEIGALRDEMHQEIGALRHEMHREIGALRDEMHQEIGALRHEMHQEIGALRVEMHALFRRQTMWTAGLFASGFSVMTAVNAWLVLATR